MNLTWCDRPYDRKYYGQKKQEISVVHYNRLNCDLAICRITETVRKLMQVFSQDLKKTTTELSHVSDTLTLINY